jgi:glycosyltransferase involved in cell wall biosynthesis
VLLLLGFVTRAKGLDVALRALARLKNEGAACRLVVAGAEDGSVDVARSVAEAGVRDLVHVLGWASEVDFFALLRAADLLLLLRFPSAGESSGVLARALGMGLSALAYDVGSAAEYPDRFVEKVAFGADPADAVAAGINRLLGDRAGLRVRGAEARDALRRDRSPDASVDHITAALRDWQQPECCIQATYSVTHRT